MSNTVSTPPGRNGAFGRAGKYAFGLDSVGIIKKLREIADGLESGIPVMKFSRSEDGTDDDYATETYTVTIPLYSSEDAPNETANL